MTEDPELKGLCCITAQDIKAAFLRQFRRAALKSLDQYRDDTGFDQAGAAAMRSELPGIMGWLDAIVQVGAPMMMVHEEQPGDLVFIPGLDLS
jgi:hypothetical protein